MFLVDAGLLKSLPANLKSEQASASTLSSSVAGEVFTRPVLVTLCLMGVLTACIFASVYAVHSNRALYTQLETVLDERDFYQAQWSQLLLEQSALTAPGRVEQIARNKLHMVLPSTDEIVVIRK